MELPILTEKENKCLMRYLTNGYKKSEAYRFAYNCVNMSDNAVNVEASRFFNNPKITLWLNEFQKNTQETVQEELNYNALQHFQELNEMKDAAMDCRDKYDNPNVNAAIKAVELKGKLAGLYKENEGNGNTVVNVMGSITLDEKKLDFNVGEAVSEAGADIGGCAEQAVIMHNNGDVLNLGFDRSKEDGKSETSENS